MINTSKVFSGFHHIGQNGTRLETGPKGLQAIAKDNVLSLRIDTGPGQGIIPELTLNPWLIKDRNSLETVTFGTIDNSQEEQKTGSLKLERRGRGLTITPDFSPIGAKTYELILFREGRIVWRQPGSLGLAGAINNSSTSMDWTFCCRNGAKSLAFTASPVTLEGGAQIDTDSIFFIPENPRARVNTVNAVELNSTGLKALNIKATSITVADPFVTYRGLGEAVVTIDGNRVAVELESMKTGGITVACGDVDRCQLNLTSNTCGDTGLVKLATSPGTGMFQSEIALRNDQTQSLNLSGISGADAEIRLDLTDDSRIFLGNETIEASKGGSGTMREIQTLLRSPTA